MCLHNWTHVQHILRLVMLALTPCSPPATGSKAQGSSCSGATFEPHHPGPGHRQFHETHSEWSQTSINSSIFHKTSSSCPQTSSNCPHHCQEDPRHSACVHQATQTHHLSIRGPVHPDWRPLSCSWSYATAGRHNRHQASNRWYFHSLLRPHPGWCLPPSGKRHEGASSSKGADSKPATTCTDRKTTTGV